LQVRVILLYLKGAAQIAALLSWTVTRGLRFQWLKRKHGGNLEVTKALAALRPLYGKDNVEIVTDDGNRIRGVVRSMKTTQALTRPSVKIERGDGEIVKIPFTNIIEIIDHNSPPASQ
jgi:hypothetical protein